MLGSGGMIHVFRPIIFCKSREKITIEQILNGPNRTIFRTRQIIGMPGKASKLVIFNLQNCKTQPFFKISTFQQLQIFQNFENPDNNLIGKFIIHPAVKTNRLYLLKRHGMAAFPANPYFL